MYTNSYDFLFSSGLDRSPLALICIATGVTLGIVMDRKPKENIVGISQIFGQNLKDFFVLCLTLVYM